ncbi:MAG: hypothetical protein GY804_08550 [Alphaproteobacteria bacterium]|nr:hypothetical protein [Alphaproteobacteria bacterium]
MDSNKTVRPVLINELLSKKFPEIYDKVILLLLKNKALKVKVAIERVVTDQFMNASTEVRLIITDDVTVDAAYPQQWLMELQADSDTKTIEDYVDWADWYYLKQVNIEFFDSDTNAAIVGNLIPNVDDPWDLKIMVDTTPIDATYFEAYVSRETMEKIDLCIQGYSKYKEKIHPTPPI